MTLAALALAGIAAAVSAAPAPKKAAAPASPDPRTMAFEPVRFDPPKVVRETLPNGIRLFLLEDHELPLVSVTVYVKAGSDDVPAGKTGLARLAGTVWRTGGSIQRTGDELDEELDHLAARLETSFGQDSGSMSLSVLRKDLSNGFALAADLLRNPAFREEKLTLAREQSIEAIRRRDDDPESTLFRELRKLIYGPSDPRGRSEEIETVRAVTRKDLQAFHAAWVRPGNLWISIAGDVTRADALALVAKHLGDWNAAPVSRPSPPPFRTPAAAAMHLVSRDSAVQSVMACGHLSPLRMTDAHYHAAQVLEQIVGGGFASRLFKEIRAKEGLAYATWAGFGGATEHQTMLFAFVGTKSETTVAALKRLKEELARAATGEVTDDELAYGKDSLLNSFVFDFEHSQQVADRDAWQAMMGLPDDFLAVYRDRVAAVTKQTVAAAAKLVLSPGSLVTLIVGRPADFAEKLETLGSVTPLRLPDASPADGAPKR